MMRRRDVIRDQKVTKLSKRDRQVFVAMLDDHGAKPNMALREAAKRYKKQVR